LSVTLAVLIKLVPGGNVHSRSERRSAVEQEALAYERRQESLYNGRGGLLLDADEVDFSD
jgi:hypothetical protein